MTLVRVATTRGIDFVFDFFDAPNANGIYQAADGDRLVFSGSGPTYTGATFYQKVGGGLVVAARLSDFSIPVAATDDLSNYERYDLLGNVEFRGGAGNDIVQLGDRHDTLYGGDGNDVLHAGLGLRADNDRLYGGEGNDTLHVIGGRDFVSGGAGSDTISLIGAYGAATIDLSRASLQTVHASSAPERKLAVQLSSVENVRGSIYDDDITGNAAANVLRGDVGNDRLDGGRGNDVLDGGNGFDYADYSAFASNAVRLSSTAAQNVGAAGSDRLVSIEGLIGGNGADLFLGNAAGNALLGNGGNDRLNGGSGDDSVLGGSGRDVLAGGLGADTLAGEAGDDVLDGGAGVDILVGGAEADRFVFRSAAEANGDLVVDFSGSQGDRLDLRLIDAETSSMGDQAFAFIGASGFTGVAGQLRYQTTSPHPGTPVFVQGDTNGDAQADFQITLQPGFPYSAGGDFVL